LLNVGLDPVEDDALDNPYRQLNDTNRSLIITAIIISMIVGLFSSCTMVCLLFRYAQNKSKKYESHCISTVAMGKALMPII